MIKKCIFVCLMMMAALSTQAAVKNDTIGIDQKGIVKFVEHKSTNSKGKETIKYFALYQGYLVQTTKNVKEKVELCSQYGARCALALIGTKTKTGFIPKRLILN